MMSIHEKALACIHQVSGSPVLKGSGLHSKPSVFAFLQEKGPRNKNTLLSS